MGGAPLLLAAILAFASLNFGLPFLLRPDEDVMVGRAVRMVAEHSFDPLFTNYPPLVFYLFAAAEGAGALFGFGTLQGAVHADPSSAYLAGRIVSASAAVLTVLFTFLAGRRAYGPAAGLLAALALAVAPLAVRQAHFATTDGVEAALVAAALWLGLRARSTRGYVLAGGLCGLAACAKYTGGFAIFFVLALAWLDQDRRRRVVALGAAAVAAFWIPGLVILFHPSDYWHGIGFLGSNAYLRSSRVPIGRTDTRRLAADWIQANVPAGAAISSPYYGGPFYDQSELRQNRYYIDDPLASGYLQGRFTDRYRINASPADLTLKASGPPEQYPVPDGGGGAAVTFSAYTAQPWDAVYDQLDSYYLPFWGFENISRPGPSIAIWMSSG